jgi:hypothetical protein
MSKYLSRNGPRAKIIHNIPIGAIPDKYDQRFDQRYHPARHILTSPDLFSL